MYSGILMAVFSFFKPPITCVPAPGTGAATGITAIIVGGAVLPVTDGVRVDAGLIQGVDHCKKKTL
jgi:hypothetical protein